MDIPTYKQLKEIHKEQINQLITIALARTGGRRDLAAKMIGISHSMMLTMVSERMKKDED